MVPISHWLKADASACSNTNTDIPDFLSPMVLN